MSGFVSQQEALLRLSASSAEAIANTLEMLAPGLTSRGDVQVLAKGQDPFATLEPGTVAVDVSYVDGVTGGNVFLAPPATARCLATLMGAGEPDDPGSELSELELSAVSEASNQMMATAARAIGTVLGQEVEISPPRCAQIATAAAADSMFGSAPYVTVTTFSVDGLPCRLVQLVPGAFVSRISRALYDLTGDLLPDGGHGTEASSAAVALRSVLEAVDLRIWVELGRVRIPLGETLELPLGAILELDRAVEEPADVYVNGVHFAYGRLMVDGEGRWSLQIDGLHEGNTLPATADSPNLTLSKGD